MSVVTFWLAPESVWPILFIWAVMARMSLMRACRLLLVSLLRPLTVSVMLVRLPLKSFLAAVMRSESTAILGMVSESEPSAPATALASRLPEPL